MDWVSMEGFLAIMVVSDAPEVLLSIPALVIALITIKRVRAIRSEIEALLNQNTNR